MRIIAGKWRSRRLTWPPTQRTRPVPDRVREAIFSSLGSWYELPGLLPPLRVADVFAGSGSMGLEALSRGAASCVFFERDAVAGKVLRQNLDALQVGPEGSIDAGDAWRTLPRRAAVEPFELILLDPPYRDTDEPTPRSPLAAGLQRLVPVAVPGLLIVLHHRAGPDLSPALASQWQVVDQRKLGTSAVSLLTRSEEA